MAELLEAAGQYVARGWCVVPIPAGQKGPVVPGWQSLRLRAEDLPAHFGAAGNVGLILGEPSGGLVDVDLDCDEAVSLAAEYLPPTAAVSGRASRPGSHRWYVAEGATTRRHQDPRTKAAIVEIRSTGAQTVVWPSIHPSGELYEPMAGEPAKVPAGMLAACVEALAKAVVRQRYGDAPESILKPPAAAPCVPSNADESKAIRRAEAYLAAMPPGIAGQGGHNATYAAAAALVNGFALPPDVAYALLANQFNPRCAPAWSEAELWHKIKDAESKPHDRPRGYLRDEPLSLVSAYSPPVGDAACGPEDERPRVGPDDPGPLPARLMNVPGFVGDVMAYNLATAQRPQPVLALAGAIALQAVLAGRKVRDERSNRTNLYIVGLAGSGAGKEQARWVNREILIRSGQDRLLGNDDIASDAGLITAVEANPAILFQLDEFGRFLKAASSVGKNPHLFAVVRSLLSLYSQADSLFKGKAYAEAKQVKVIDQPCVSLMGTSVPGNFFDSLTADAMVDGLMGRLLLFEGDPLPNRTKGKRYEPPAELLARAKWWGDLATGGNLGAQHPSPRLVPDAEDAGEVLDAYSENIDRRIRGDSDGGAQALWARAAEKACRLALIAACSAGEPLRITGEAMTWGCELADYLTRRTLVLADGWMAEGVFDARQKRVMRIIRAAGGEMELWKLNRATRWLTERERTEVMNNLLVTGVLVVENLTTLTKQKTIYRVAER